MRLLTHEPRAHPARRRVAGAPFRGLALAVVVCAILLVSASLASALELPDTALPEYFVGLFTRPTITESGFCGTLPVQLREFRPLNSEEASRVQSVLPDDFTWDFSQGFGQLMPKDSRVPCRAFVLGLTPLRASGLKARVRAAAPQTYRNVRLDLGLGAMGMAVVGAKGRDLSSIFPVPFMAAPAKLADELTLLAMKTSYPDSITTSVSAKLEGIPPAMMQELCRRRVLDKVAAVKAINDVSPYKELTEGGQNYFSSYVGSTATTTVVKGGLADILANRKSDLLKPKLWLGKVPGSQGTNLALDLSTSVGLPTTSADYQISLHPFVRADGVADFDGFALPAAGSSRIDVLLSPLPATTYNWLMASMVRHLVRGWRWKQILTAPGTPMTQTLLRLNEPLWDYLVWKTVEVALDPKVQIGRSDRLDLLDMSILDVRIQDARGGVNNPSFAQRRSQAAAPCGVAGDGFFPAGELLDHQLCKLLVGALDGGGGLTALLPASVSTAAAGSAKPQFARKLVELLAGGFTRGERPLSVSAALTRLGGGRGPSGAPDVTREPDLVWLDRALTAMPTGAAFADNALVHLLGQFSGSRLQLAIRELVGPGGCRSVEWSKPPTLPPDTLFYLLTKDSADDLLTAVTYPKRKFSAIPKQSARVRALATEGKANAWSQRWWTGKSQAFAPPTTIGDTRVYQYLAGSHALDALSADLRGLTTAPGYVDCLTFKWDPRGMSHGLVAATPSTRSVAQQKVTSALTNVATMLEQLSGTGSGVASGLYYRLKVKPLFPASEKLMFKAWELYLIGPGLNKTLPAPSTQHFKNLLGAVARATGATATFKKAGTQEVLTGQ
ncbi:MAG: hypothetical protein HY814_06820 [Candidatus Riflebacteria bacterium]|nr:hypothetical protein [Candidatus Riflebacteria bacterium]